MGKYRKKPIVIEAVQLTRKSLGKICEFVEKEAFGRSVWVSKATMEYSDNRKDGYDRIGIIIKTLEGDHLAVEGDYIIKGVNGEFYPCKPDIFEKTYEKMED